jgi:hypothetical protein
LIVSCRAELTCYSYVHRKNRNRDVERLKTGPKVDGLLHDKNDRGTEHAVLECGRRSTVRDCSTKLRDDQDKMRKLMRDMIGSLAFEVDHERQVVEKLQVFGIFTAGYRIQAMRMTQPNGYICLLKWYSTLAIPNSIAKFSKLSMVLSYVLRIRVCTC